MEVEMDEEDHSNNGAKNLPIKREKLSVQVELDDRLTLSEAIDLVCKMLRGFPNRHQADNAYIGAVAQLLMDYPRSVAIACTHHKNGIVADVKFMPVPADIIAWCEKRTEPLRRIADWNSKAEIQLRETEEWRNAPKNLALLAKCEAWLDRSDPKYQRLIGDREEELRQRKELLKSEIKAANERLFAREDTGRGISQSLSELLGTRAK
jgi:hypothetical protein